MLDDTSYSVGQTDVLVAELGALPVAPMHMRTQTLFAEKRHQPGLISRLGFLFSPRTGH